METFFNAAMEFLKISKKKEEKPEMDDTEKEERGSNLSTQNRLPVDYVQNVVENELRGGVKNRGKLFVGGLNQTTTTKKLEAYFSIFGKVLDSVVMRFPTTGKSRGFGFVTFANVQDAEKALQTKDHILDGKVVECRRFNAGADPQHRRKSDTRVFLGGLPVSITKQDLKQFFSRYGEVVDVIIPHDRETKQPKGFGFVAFKEEESAKKCLADRFLYLNERRVVINRADSRDNSVNALAQEWDDSISIDSELSGPKDDDSLPDDTCSSASGQRLIEFEHPELKQLFQNYFLEKLAYCEMSDEIDEDEKWQPPKNDFGELEKTLKKCFVNYESESADNVGDDCSNDEEDYENHAGFSLSQGEFHESTLECCSDRSATKSLPREREELDCAFYARQRHSAFNPSPIPVTDSKTDSLMCSLCQWSPPDMSFDTFLTHCKTSAHRAKLKERFSTQKSLESELESKLVMKSEKPKEVHLKLRSYPKATVIREEDSEKQTKIQSAPKGGTKQQKFPPLEQQQILQRLQQLQLTAQHLQEKKERVEQKKPNKPEKQKKPKEQESTEQKQRDILQPVGKDGIAKPTEEKSKNLQKKPQNDEKQKNNLNSKVRALAKGMSCIRPTADGLLLCQMCNKKIPKASDFDVLMKNVSQHLQSKKHLNNLLVTEESLKTTSKGQTLSSEGKNSNEKKVQGKKKPEKTELQNIEGKNLKIHNTTLSNKKGPLGCNGLSSPLGLEEGTNNSRKNLPEGKDRKPQIATLEQENVTRAKRKSKTADASKGRFVCLKCNYSNDDNIAFNEHLKSVRHSYASEYQELISSKECDFCQRIILGSLFDINIHHAKCRSGNGN